MDFVFADHEGRFELSRIAPAVAVGIAIIVVGVALVIALRRRSDDRGGRVMALVGLGLLVIGVIAGVIQREAAGGDAQCGPVFNEWTGSAACDEALAEHRALVLSALVASALAFATAFGYTRRDVTDSDRERQPSGGR